ncbi:ISL3 family transposase [Polymorphospora rubra]|uniref:Transposase n=1 Tax=Polymorphospora rubra TaxID=338584 RepID=A0A810MX47_9ACTN|nr:transposase [Polymorphospora rubra]
MAIIKATTMTSRDDCPGCGVVSTRVHGRYRRRLADVALARWPVLLDLQVRRFRCATTACVRRTFVEQVDGLTHRFARRSLPLRQLLVTIGLALAGRAGARLTRALAIPASANTLLRMLRIQPDQPLARAPRVLGVDDFALKRGHVYGTVLIDIEAGRPIDVLPDRTAKTLTTWLRHHPGAEIISRDRASSYAEAARLAAPDAIQVADRFHLWKNLRDVVEKCVAAHRACLTEPTPTPDTDPPTAQSDPADQIDARWDGPRAARTRQRHAAVHELRVKGVGISAIADTLGLDRKTVRRYAHTTTAEELLTQPAHPGGKTLQPYLAHLHRRWNEGCTDAATLHAEIREQGYRGSHRTVRRHLQPIRHSGLPALTTPATPTTRQVTAWIVRKPDSLAAGDQNHLTQILTRCPELNAVATCVTSFAAIMDEHRGHDLPEWLTQADATELAPLRSFTRGLRHDLAAVTAGLTLPWNSGPVEGHVNRIKMLKRQMCGRASFDLLRHRILHA